MTTTFPAIHKRYSGFGGHRRAGTRRCIPLARPRGHPRHRRRSGGRAEHGSSQRPFRAPSTRSATCARCRLPSAGPALHKAAEIFANSVIAGLDFDQYVALASRTSGLPIGVTRAGARDVAAALKTAFDAVWHARPAGAVFDWREERTRWGCAVWARRGEVFAVHAPGNTPRIHGLWLQALALGYRVAIRPSRREPFTAHRLIVALRHAGFRPEDAVYLPIDHAGADEIITAADLAMVYGGQDVVDKYADDPTLITNGPGRTKILINRRGGLARIPRRDRRLDRQPGRHEMR